MAFPLASRALPGLEVLDTSPSTNAELVRRERVAAQPRLTALATLHQTRGKGRLGRSWVAPPGAALAVSVLIRPDAVPPERRGLLTLLGGLAARTAVQGELPGVAVELKWPNDVLIAGRKLVGVLAEVVPETGAVVLGIGVNTAMSVEQLPVPTATSIAIARARGVEAGGVAESAEALADRVLAVLLESLVVLLDRFEAAAGDLDRSGLRRELEASMGTIGRLVSVELPDGTAFTGRAAGLRGDGALLVEADRGAGPGSGVERDGRSLTAILAGDVTHLRYQ